MGSAEVPLSQAAASLGSRSQPGKSARKPSGGTLEALWRHSRGTLEAVLVIVLVTEALWRHPRGTLEAVLVTEVPN